jgi:ankyrin repeat protein
MRNPTSNWDCTGNSALYQNPKNWNQHANMRADWETKFSTGDFGETPFYLAAKNSRLTLSEVMIEYENFKDEHPEGKFGNTLLHMAAKVGNIPLYQMIIDNIEDKNPKNDRGETPFHEAAKNGHLQICQILKDTYNVLGKELKIYAMAALIEKVADNGHFDLIAWIYDNNMTDE